MKHKFLRGILMIGVLSLFIVSASGLNAKAQDVIPVTETVAIPDKSLSAPVAVDLLSEPGILLPAGNTPAAGLTSIIDCQTQQGIIIHDDGTIENGYSGNPDAGEPELRLVDRFTPSGYPATFTGICVAFISVGVSVEFDFNIVVYDDDGPGDTPGTLLGSQAVTGVSDLFVNGKPPLWNGYYISTMGLIITSGSVYIGVQYEPSSPNVFTASDETATNPVGYAGGYWWNNIIDEWAPIQDVFPVYRSLFVRVVAEEASSLYLPMITKP